MLLLLKALEGISGRARTYALWFIVRTDKGLQAEPGSGHGMAAQSAIALRAHQLGFVPTFDERTPLNWMPDYAIDLLQSGRPMRRGWQSSVCGTVAREPARACRSTRLYPRSHGRRRANSLAPRAECTLLSPELCSVGIVRLFNLHGGRGDDGVGFWHHWDDLVDDEWLAERGATTEWLRVRRSQKRIR